MRTVWVRVRGRRHIATQTFSEMQCMWNALRCAIVSSTFECRQSEFALFQIWVSFKWITYTLVVGKRQSTQRQRQIRFVFPLRLFRANISSLEVSKVLGNLFFFILLVPRTLTAEGITCIDCNTATIKCNKWPRLCLCVRLLEFRRN